MKHLPLLFVLAVATCLTGCKDQKKSDTDNNSDPSLLEPLEPVKPVQKVDSIVFPLSPEEIAEIYDSMVTDSLYINHHFADRGMELVMTENYEDAVDTVMRNRCYFHEWAYHAQLDTAHFPNIRYFDSDFEDGFGLSLENLDDRRHIVINLFSSRAKDLFADLITKAGYTHQFTDSLNEDGNGNKSLYNTVTYYHKENDEFSDPFFTILNINGSKYQVTFEQYIDEPMPD